jgi:hypothetical protein
MVLEAVLRACGNDVSAENIMKLACSIQDLELPAGHQLLQKNPAALGRIRAGIAQNLNNSSSGSRLLLGGVRFRRRARGPGWRRP